MTITEITVLVQGFQRLDGGVVDFLQITEDYVGYLLEGLLLLGGLVVDVEQFVNVRSISKVRWDFVLLVRHEEHTQTQLRKEVKQLFDIIENSVFMEKIENNFHYQ